jgi:hypothetical protein
MRQNELYGDLSQDVIGALRLLVIIRDSAVDLNDDVARGMTSELIETWCDRWSLRPEERVDDWASILPRQRH